MIKNWNDVIGKNDIVFHLGDIAAGIRGREDALIKIFKRLNGKKYLIRGNHDRKTGQWYRDNLGFEDVMTHLIMDDILLFHYPLRTNKHSSSKEINKIEEMKKLVEKNNVKHIIHGHVHNRTTDLPDHYNVSVEVINYTPININDLLP